MTAPETNRRQAFAADGFASGLAIMLALTVVQRGVGFFRGIWLCRLMEDSVVGQWSMALGFITMITPLMMLGLPGAMPRYVERYRIAGQLSKFLYRVILGTLLGASVVMSFMLISPEQVGYLIFRETASTSLILSISVAILCVLVFNFVNELVSSLRQVRTVSMMQFLQGVGFTVLGLGVLYAGGGLRELILSYALSSLIATVPGIRVLWRDWAGLPTPQSEFDAAGMWRSLMPYAAALWMMNLLANSFELSDRYMIFHWTPGGEEAASAAVGQYHCGRLIPTLFTSLAMMFGGVLMPYLTADWEAGNIKAVQDRLTRCLFAMSLLFTICAAVTVGISPLLFETLLEGRYDAGMGVQAMAFTFCIWAAIVTVAQNYLWVRERGAWMAVSLTVGLSVNALLNYLLLPRYGLGGAVAATLVANGVVMLGTFLTMVRLGYRFDPALIWVAILPMSLMLDWRVSVAVCVAAPLLHREAQTWILDFLREIALKVPRTSANAR